jgi:hypothetical protein
MNTCGTCKFFGKLVPSGDWDDRGDEIPSKFHACQLVKHLKHQDDTEKDNVAVVMDGSGYYAALCVSEEFGCNQWQEALPTESQP